MADDACKWVYSRVFRPLYLLLLEIFFDSTNPIMRKMGGGLGGINGYGVHYVVASRLPNRPVTAPPSNV